MTTLEHPHPVNKVRATRASGAQQAVMSVMTRRIGIHTTYSDLLELLPTLSHAQVASATNHLYKKGLLIRVSNGIYVYRAEPEDAGPNSHVYEGIGKLDGGQQVVRSDNGKLYVLQTLEDFFKTGNGKEVS